MEYVQEHETNGRGKRGLGTKTQALLDQAVAVVEEFRPITVRGVCYKLFVRGAIAGMVVSETQKVSRLLVYARENDIIPCEYIVDESRQMERPLRFDNLAHFAVGVQRWYRKDFWSTQPYCLQVWSEKSTVGGLIRPITEKYGVPFMAVHGYGSYTVMRNAADLSVGDDRELVIIYVGDHDPSGMHMSEIDLPARTTRYGGKLTVRRIALRTEDVADLPSFKIKETTNEKKGDPRSPWYKKLYGPDAWELDAMDPNVLRARVEANIRAYINQDEWQRMQLIEAAEQQTVREWAAALTR